MLTIMLFFIHLVLVKMVNDTNWLMKLRIDLKIK